MEFLTGICNFYLLLHILVREVCKYLQLMKQIRARNVRPYSLNGVTKTIGFFFLVDISDIHTVSNHSILKYEALPYHGRSLRALSDYLLLYFQSNENKSMFSLAFKIQELRWYFRHAGRNNHTNSIWSHHVRLERTERHSLESLACFRFHFVGSNKNILRYLFVMFHIFCKKHYLIPWSFSQIYHAIITSMRGKVGKSFYFTVAK